MVGASRGARVDLIILFLPLIHGLVYILSCLMKVFEGIVSEYIICWEVKLIVDRLRLRPVLEVLKLIILDVKYILNECQVGPRVIQHRV